MVFLRAKTLARSLSLVFLLGTATTSPTHQLLLLQTRLINPNITSTAYDTWFTALLPRLTHAQHYNATLAVSYSPTSTDNASRPAAGEGGSWDHSALFKIPPAKLNSSVPITASMLISADGAGPVNAKRKIRPKDVEVSVSLWNPIQTFQGLREKRGTVPDGRPKVACIVKIEPKEGGDEELETWYHHQVFAPFHLTPATHLSASPTCSRAYLTQNAYSI
jgi:hypothetical protein